MTKDAASVPQNQPLASHQFAVTIFPNNAAQKKNQQYLTLPLLADFIYDTRAARKDQLPLLKLASFGDVVSTKRCLRTNANMGDISGIEIEHDSGTVSFKHAVKVLREAGLRALVYTTPSHVPISRERWRALLPLSVAAPKTTRAALVALVNGLFDGQLARESFALSQAFYFGEVDGSRLQIQVLDGDCLDLVPPDISNVEPIYPAAAKGTNGAGTVGASHTLEDLDAMLDAYQRTGDGWHNTMLTLTASLVSRGWADAQITEKLGPYCWRGPDDPELWDLLTSARAKFGLKPPPAALKAILGTGANSGELTPEPVTAPKRPADDAAMADKVAWLLATHGWDETEGRVVKLWETSERCRIRLADFQVSYAAWFEIQIGPRGGQNRALATAGWLSSPARAAIAGVRMAPDRPFPVFEEDGAHFKNTYQRPSHAVNDGDVTAFLSFLEHLIPDRAQRDYLLDYLAHKWRFPEVPGCGVMFVADNDGDADGAREGLFGAGRGILFSIVHKLLGGQYCAEQDWRILDGSSGQSIYTDWLHNNVLVTVDEAPSSPTHYRRGERSAAYEVLKRVIDPAPTKRTFVGKYQQAFTGTCHCSVWIATNHYDALAIPAEDRRISVLRNGRPITKAGIASIIAWREAPGSLGALAAFLEARDLAGFDMYEPMASDAKAAMVEANLTEVEQAFLDLAEDKGRGLVFTRQDLLNAVRGELGESVGGHFEHAWRRWVSKAISETDGSQRRVRTGGTQRKLFCFRRNAQKVKTMNEEFITAHARRWNSFSGLGSRLGSQDDPETDQ